MRYSGDIAKSLAAGSDSVMLGSIFAGSDESPGEIVLWEGRRFKKYRGMGSIGAMKDGSSDRYFQKKNTPKPKNELSESLKKAAKDVCFLTMI